MLGQVKFKRLPVFGLGSKQSAELLEPLHAEEASRGVMMVVWWAEGLVLLDRPLSSVGDGGLERHSQLHQVDGGGAPDDNVRVLVTDGNVLEEAVLAWKVGCDLHP